MKITLFGNIKNTQWTSASMDRFALELSRSLLEKNQDVSLIEPSFPFLLDILPAKYKFILGRFKYYPLLAKSIHSQVYHITDHSYGQVAQYLPLEKTVITCHDLIPLRYEKDSFSLKYFRQSIGWLSKVALVLADSQATKRDIIEFLNIKPEKIKVVYLGRSDAFQVLDSEKIRSVCRKYNLPTDKPKLLHVGHNHAYKNIPNILKALDVLKDDFVLIKVGPALNHPNVLNLGTIPEEDLPALYNSVDLLVYPSLHEGFGFPTLEALSCGTRVVISRGNSLQEIAGDSALYVDPEDPSSIARGIEKGLSMTEKEKTTLIQKGLERSKEFTWDKTVRETLACYEELVK